MGETLPVLLGIVKHIYHGFLVEALLEKMLPRSSLCRLQFNDFVFS